MPFKFKKTEKQLQAMNLLTSNANHVMLYGGARSGKTAILCYAMVIRACKTPSRHLIARTTLKSVKGAVFYDTFPKLMDLAFPNLKYKRNKSESVVYFPNGSEIWFGGLESKERAEKILGKEYATIFINEVTGINYKTIPVILSRAAQKTSLKNKIYYDCNPTHKNHWTYKVFKEFIHPFSYKELDKNKYVSLQMNPIDNKENIVENYIEDFLHNMTNSERKRFEFGEWGEDVAGSLWRYEDINPYRIVGYQQPKFKDIIVAIDPAISKGDFSDETGIIVCAIDQEEKGYVLDDLSGKYTPAEWAKVTINAWKIYNASVIVAEKNQGGDMVLHTLQTEMRNVPVKMVHASKGKQARADPVVANYQQGRVHHVGNLEKLEDQMISWVPSENVYSPDRIDALVWGLSYLMLKKRCDVSIMVL